SGAPDTINAPRGLASGRSATMPRVSGPRDWEPNRPRRPVGVVERLATWRARWWRWGWVAIFVLLCLLWAVSPSTGFR
ncbi:MAG: hypothetical protein ACSLFP_18080, partial [Acidimicrobiales bacterium]